MKNRFVVYGLLCMFSFVGLFNASSVVYAQESEEVQSEVPAEAQVDTRLSDIIHSDEYAETKKELEDILKEKSKELEGKTPDEIKEDIEQKKAEIAADAASKVADDARDVVVSRAERKKRVIEANNHLVENVKNSRPKTLSAIADAKSAVEPTEKSVDDDVAAIVDTADVNDELKDSLAKRIADYPSVQVEEKQIVETADASVGDKQDEISIADEKTPLAVEENKADRFSLWIKVLAGTVFSIGLVAMLFSIYKKYQEEF